MRSTKRDLGRVIYYVLFCITDILFLCMLAAIPLAAKNLIPGEIMDKLILAAFSALFVIIAYPIVSEATYRLKNKNI